MTSAHVLVELVIVLGAAAAVTLLFQAVRLPVVLGYVVAGLVIGPHVPVPLVANTALISVLSELGVILLMFALGLELRLSTLARVGVGAGLTALFEVALVLTIGAITASALGFGSGEAIFAGACVAISSTMLVARAFEEQKWKGGFTEVVFAILVFEDLIAIALLAVLAGLASGTGLAPRELAITLGKLAGFLAVVLVVGLLIVPRFVRIVARQSRSETLLIVALGICFGLAILTEHVGYPVALGAFAAGLLVSESGLGHEISELVRPFRDVFAMMFFVSIGMTIEPDQLANNVPTILLFTAVVLIAKPIGVSLGSFAAGRGIQPSIRSGVSLAQTGELSFVIAGIGVTSGVARPSLLAIAVGVTCLTTLTSSVMIKHSDPIARVVAARLPARLATFVSFYENWLGRLRGRERAAAWREVRRPVFVLVADTAAIIAIVIGGSILAGRAMAWVGMGTLPSRIIVTAGGLVAIAPFGIGLIRRIAQISRLLALRVIPGPRPTAAPPMTFPPGAAAAAARLPAGDHAGDHAIDHPGAAAAVTSPPPPDDHAADHAIDHAVDHAVAAAVALDLGPGVDLGLAPRRALTLTLELAIATAVAVPTIALVHPFIGTSGLIAGAVLLVMLAITYRSIVDFTQHVRAGSELILELMHHPPSSSGTDQPLAQIESVLPGFGGLVSVTISPTSPAVGHSLADLDLRARTGASVLAIARGEGGFASPAPTEPLKAGDVLALTGSIEALAAARTALA